MASLRFVGDHLGVVLLPKVPVHLSSRAIHIPDLPPELLAHIFLATTNDSSKCQCTFARHEYVHPTTLSSVCRTWRHISLSLPQLWSHIDLVTEWASVADSWCDRVRVMNERSAGAALDLCIRAQTIPTRDLSPRRRIYLPITEEALAPLMALWTPLAPRIRRLHISSDICAASELQPFLISALRLCINGTVDTLDVHTVYKDQPSTRLLRFHGSARLPSSHQIDAFMNPIRVLRLRDAFIPAENSVYAGLVELSLVSISSVQLHSREQMTQILSSCPGLRWLSLKNVHLVNSGQSPIEPVHLKQLEHLELECDDPSRLAPLLRLLQPECQGVTVKVDVCKEPKLAEHFREFLDRCPNISALSIKPKDDKAWFTPLRHGLSGLPTLTLERCDFGDPDLVQHGETDSSPIVPWPCLHTLRLEHCIIQLDLLELLTGSRYLRRLVLIQCKVRNPYSEDPTPVVLSEVARQLAHSDIAITAMMVGRTE